MIGCATQQVPRPELECTRGVQRTARGSLWLSGTKQGRMEEVRGVPRSLTILMRLLFFIFSCAFTLSEMRPDCRILT